MLRAICVEFSKDCGEQNILYNPTVRMHKPDGTFSVFERKRTVEELVKCFETTVGKSHHIDAFSTTDVATYTRHFRDIFPKHTCFHNK